MQTDSTPSHSNMDIRNSRAPTLTSAEMAQPIVAQIQNVEIWRGPTNATACTGIRGRTPPTIASPLKACVRMAQYATGTQCANTLAATDTSKL
jgi:hypothetical protein